MQPARAAVPGRERPRFRQDLIAELIEAPGARFIDVVAPEGGDVFRFYEVEYSLACGMDGDRDIAGIVKWAQDELGLSPSQQEVRAVVATLGDLGFIEGQAAEAAAAEAANQAADAAAPELAPGVAAPSRSAPPAAPSGIDRSAAGPGAPRGGAMSPSPEVARGGPGGQRITRPTPAPASEVAPGGASAPGGQRITRPTPAPAPPSEVSIDLADHIEVRPDDVKEAVRASKVMFAVEAPQDEVPQDEVPQDEVPQDEVPQDEVPQDVIDAIDAIHDRTTGPVSAGEPAFSLPQVSRPPEVRRPEVSRPPEVTRQSEATRQSESAWLSEPSPDSDSRFDPRPESRIGKPTPVRPPAASRPPVELPPPVISDKMPTSTVRTQPPQRQGSSPFLVAVFFLVILAAGGYFVWKYVLNKGPAATTTSAPAPQAVKPPPPPAPPPPPPTAKIGHETPPPAEVTLSRAGQIETILADKTVVKENDVILRLVGDKPLEAELGGLGRDQKRMQDAIDALTRRRDAAHTAGNKAAEAAATAEITERQRTLTLKQNALAAKTAELDNFLIRAPTSGTFSPVVKPGAKIAADTVVAKVQREAVPAATFKLGNTRAIAANASVELAIGKGEQRVTCTIVDVQPDSVKVTCPVDPALTDGTEVALNAPASTAPEAPAPPPPPPGSAEAPAPPSPSGTGSETAPAPSGTAPAEGGSAAAAPGQPGQPEKTP
jgi:hypothetical protein